MDPTRYVQIQIETTSPTYSAFKWKLRRILLVNTTISLEWTVHNTTVTLRYSAYESVLSPLPTNSQMEAKYTFLLYAKQLSVASSLQISKLVKFGTQFSPTCSEALHHRGLYCATNDNFNRTFVTRISPMFFHRFSHVERLWHLVYICTSLFTLYYLLRGLSCASP